jgi:hypothetical protein
MLNLYLGDVEKSQETLTVNKNFLSLNHPEMVHYLEA